MKDEIGLDTGLAQMIEETEREKAPFRKTIIVRTTREPNNLIYRVYFPEDINYRGHISRIEFSHPVKDWRRRKNKTLTLVTSWFNGAFEENPYWNQWINSEKGYVLLSTEDFGRLSGHFSDYSKSKLRDWQQIGLNTHERILDKIKGLYYQQGKIVIPENFLCFP